MFFSARRCGTARGVTGLHTRANDTEQLATRRVGLRTVELVQEPRPANSYGKTGKSFFFRVNGVDVFAKGSNYIPADVFQPRVTEGYLDVRHDAPLCCNLCPSTFVKLK